MGVNRQQDNYLCFLFDYQWCNTPTLEDPNTGEFSFVARYMRNDSSLDVRKRDYQVIIKFKRYQFRIHASVLYFES
jgi:hypothetical protein